MAMAARSIHTCRSAVLASSSASDRRQSTSASQRASAWLYERGREAAGVEPPTLHECRHGYASVMIAAGVNVKALSTFMGHANIKITLDQYGHLLPGAEDEAAGLLDAFLARQVAQTDGPDCGAPRAKPLLERVPLDVLHLKAVRADGRAHQLTSFQISGRRASSSAPTSEKSATARLR